MHAPFAFGLAFLAAAGAAHANWRDASSQLPQSALADRSMDVRFGDVDGDGDLDVLVAREFASNLLLRNSGGFRFSVDAAAIPARAEDSEDVVAADFDRDGDLDVVFVSEDTPNAEYYRNDGSGRFADAPCALPAQLESNGAASGDLDRDGDLDLVVASNRLPERVLLNDGDGCFRDASAAWMPAVVDVTQDVLLADLDGDGDLDLVTGNEPAAGGRNRLYLNAGGRFEDATATRLPAARQREETRKVAGGDIDGDGDLDLVFGNVDFQDPSRAANRVLLNDGGARFTDQSAERLPEGNRATLDVQLHDLDGDGDLDQVLANFGSGLQVLRNDGGGRFAEATADVLGPLALPRNSIGLAVARDGGRLWLYEAGFNVVDRLLVRDPAQPALDQRHSGAFFVPTQSGHGFFLSVLESAVTITWATYDSDGRPIFLTAAAPPPAPGQSTLELPAILTRGMRFGEFDPATLRIEPWGTFRWTVLDCDRVDFDWRSDYPMADGRPFGTGRLALVRYYRFPGLDCRA
jgi:hypothetical protein